VTRHRRAAGRSLRFAFVSAFASFVVAASLLINPVFAEDARKVKTSFPPEYPDIARQNNIQGSARLQVVVAPDGTIKDIKVLGGNAVLVKAAIEAVKKWKYEPAAGESTVILKFDFKPEVPPSK
jgi:TonB family protein